MSEQFSTSHKSNSTDTLLDAVCLAYNEHDADITLRSSDGMLFNVHALIMRLASDVFEGMVTMPQSPSKNLDIVQFTEEGDIIRALLDSIYPRRMRPELHSFDFVSRLAAAADKYDIPDVTNRIREMISNGSSSFPGSALQKYALASRFGWDSEARYASRLTTAPDTEDPVERRVLETMGTEPLLKLFSLHRRRHSMFMSMSISFQTSVPEETRMRQLRWESLSIGHAPCRSQHINRTTWSAFKSFALAELETMPPAGCFLGFRDGFWDDNRLTALWDDKCTKCGMSFFVKSGFVSEFTRALRHLPMTID